MKSQKGVTMLSLILYVASFLAVTAVVAGITTFFYNNVEILDTSIGSNSQYNKVNLYMLNECKKVGNSLIAWKNIDSATDVTADTANNIDMLTATSFNANEAFLTFRDSNISNESNNKHSFIYVKGEKNLYYDSIKLCENVDEFKFKIDYSSGKTVLKMFINIDGTAFTTEYVVAS